MITNFLSITFIGDNLSIDSESLVFTEFQQMLLKQSVKKGEYTSKGRFLNEPIDYGYIEFQTKYDNGASLGDALKFVRRNLPFLLKQGLEEIWLNVNIHSKGQSNLEFENDDLKEIVSMNIKLSITYIN